MSARLSILAYGLERRQQRRRDGPASVGSCRHMLDVLDGWAVTVGTNEGLLGRGWQVRSGTLPTRRKVVTASCEAGAKPQSIVGSSALALDWLSSRANNATLGGKCIASKPSNMHISGRVQTGYMQHHPLIGEYTLERNELKRLRKSANFALFVSMCRQVVRLASRAAFSLSSLCFTHLGMFR